MIPRTIPFETSPLYSIIDFSCFAAKPDPIMAIVGYAEELIAAGATLIQLRDKSQPSAENHLKQDNVPSRFLSLSPRVASNIS